MDSKKSFDILMLAPETPLGQAIINKVNQTFKTLQILIPTGKYSSNVFLPPNQFPVFDSINPENMEEGFAMAHVVISCSSQYSTPPFKDLASKTNSTFIDACGLYPETVIEAVLQRLPFKPTELKATQHATISILGQTWKFAHSPKAIEYPIVTKENTYVIKQEDIKINDMNVPHEILFKSRFLAILFWFITFLFHFIPWSVTSPQYESDWSFHGSCEEHDTPYTFELSAISPHGDDLRPDLALAKSLESLNLEGIGKRDWHCCSKLNYKMLSYERIN